METGTGLDAKSPAVSQHLTVLTEAGLMSERRRTRTAGTTTSRDSLSRPAAATPARTLARRRDVR
jgi:DNA-binding transcriptional ArsR family regulator